MYKIALILLFFTCCSCTFVTTNHVAYKYGKTKKIRTDFKLNLPDTLAIIKPFAISYEFNNAKAVLEFRSHICNLFDVKTNDTDYTIYDQFYEPRVWGGPDPYYKTRFLNPLNHYFKKKINLYIPDFQDNHLATIRTELSKLEKTVNDSSVSEVLISDSLYEALLPYPAGNFLVTDIVDYYYSDFRYHFSSVVEPKPYWYAWYRIFVINMKLKKIIFYGNSTEIIGGGRGGNMDPYIALKYSLRKLKRILP